MNDEDKKGSDLEDDEIEFGRRLDAGELKTSVMQADGTMKAENWPAEWEDEYDGGVREMPRNTGRVYAKGGSADDIARALMEATKDE